jgi:general secretion pathway protein J
MRNDSGFTLLELLVSMTLLSFLSLVLYGALSYGVRSWHRAEELSVQSNDVRRVQTALTRELGVAYPEQVTADPTHMHVDFDGREHAVSFLASDPEHPGALDRVELGLVDGALVRRASLELSSNAKTTSIALLHGVAALDLSYFGSEGDNRDPHWQSSWQGRKSLPLFVRIRARMAAKGASPFPDLTIAPRVTADVGCDFDPLTKNCRGQE